MIELFRKAVSNFLGKIVSLFPLGNYIIFESFPDYSDNSKKVYDAMISTKALDKYKMIWLCAKKPTKKNSNRTYFIYRKGLRASFFIKKAKAIICCNAFITPYSPKQFSIYLTHGTAIKGVGNYRIPASIKYSLAASENITSMMMSLFSFSNNNQVVPLGYPRNDDLTNFRIDLKPLFKNSFEKIVVWLPTFRQHSSGLKTGSSHTIPLLWDKENIIAIDKACSQLKILLVIKPHFAQDVSFIQSIGAKNILFINDNFFNENGMTFYMFLGNCDALLTDYSSVYFDFTLCDKPIGLIWEDYEEYKSNPGFSVDMDFAMKGGVKIYSKKDLLDFLTMVYNNEDVLRNERRQIRDYYNCSTDGKNTIRVVDFIVSKARLIN